MKRLFSFIFLLFFCFQLFAAKDVKKDVKTATLDSEERSYVLDLFLQYKKIAKKEVTYPYQVKIIIDRCSCLACKLSYFKFDEDTENHLDFLLDDSVEIPSHEYFYIKDENDKTLLSLGAFLEAEMKRLLLKVSHGDRTVKFFKSKNFLYDKLRRYHFSSCDLSNNRELYWKHIERAIRNVLERSTRH